MGRFSAMEVNGYKIESGAPSMMPPRRVPTEVPDEEIPQRFSTEFKNSEFCKKWRRHRFADPMTAAFAAANSSSESAPDLCNDANFASSPVRSNFSPTGETCCAEVFDS